MSSSRPDVVADAAPTDIAALVARLQAEIKRGDSVPVSRADHDNWCAAVYALICEAASALLTLQQRVATATLKHKEDAAQIVSLMHERDAQTQRADSLSEANDMLLARAEAAEAARVPREPTGLMMKMGLLKLAITGGDMYADVRAIWRAMYDAALKGE